MCDMYTDKQTQNMSGRRESKRVRGEAAEDVHMEDSEERVDAEDAGAEDENINEGEVEEKEQIDDGDSSDDTEKEEEDEQYEGTEDDADEDSLSESSEDSKTKRFVNSINKKSERHKRYVRIKGKKNDEKGETNIKEEGRNKKNDVHKEKTRKRMRTNKNKNKAMAKRIRSSQDFNRIHEGDESSESSDGVVVLAEYNKMKKGNQEKENKSGK